MDSKQLKSFLTVATAGSLTRAATLLGLAQPAVTRQIQQLEEAAGTPLFIRTRWGVQLTDAGRTLMGYAERVVEQLEQAKAAMGQHTGTVAGTVTVGMPPSVIERVAAPLATSIKEAYPELRLRLVSGYSGFIDQWLAAGDLDVALVQHSLRPLASGVQPLLEEPLWIAGPATANLKQRRPMDAAALLQLPLVLPSATHVIRARMEALAAEVGKPLRVAIEADAMTMQKCLVRAGLGYTVLPVSVLLDDVKAGTLTATPLADAELLRVIGVVANPRSVSTRAAQYVQTHLIDCMRELVTHKHWPEARWLGSPASASATGRSRNDG